MVGQQVGYIRVSSLEQNEARQFEAIRQCGIELDESFVDHTSGKDTKREALENCLKYLRKGDSLYVASIDRLARNLRDLQDIVDQLVNKGVTIRFLKENMTFSPNESANPMQKLLLQILGSFAEFERTLIKERQREGIYLARKAGKKIGGGRLVKPEEAEEIRQRIKAGEPIAQIAKAMHFSRPTIYKWSRQGELAR